MAIRTFYEILGIAHDADDEEIRRAYRRVMQEHHPDQNPDDRKAARRTRYLNAAKEALLDKDKRRRYDRKLRRKGIFPDQHAADLQEPDTPPDEPSQGAATTGGSASEETPATPNASTSGEAEPARTRADRWSANRSRPSYWMPKPHFKTAPTHRRLWVAGGGLVLLATVLLAIWFSFSIANRPTPTVETPRKPVAEAQPPGRPIPKPMKVVDREKTPEPKPAGNDPGSSGSTSNPPATTSAEPTSSNQPAESAKTEPSKPRPPLTAAPFDAKPTPSTTELSALLQPISVPDPPELPAGWARSAATDKRLLIPGEKERDKASSAIQKEFGPFNLGSYRGAARAIRMNRIGVELLRSTSEKHDAPQLYSKLDGARQFFAMSGDSFWADRCIDLLVENFRVDYLSLHIDAARTWSRLIEEEWVPDKSARRKLLWERVERLSDQAGRVHRYLDQQKLLELYLDLLPPNHKDIAATKENIASARKRSERHREMMHLREQLVLQPDPVQATELGQYLCFELDEWNQGVPYLAVGDTGPMQKAAQYEMEEHDSADARLWIGDGWWKLAKEHTDAAGQKLKDRAGEWYLAAYPDLSGDEKRQVAERLIERFGQPRELHLLFQHGSQPDHLIQRGKTARRESGLVLYPGSAIALDKVFSSIESITIRGRIQGSANGSFRFQAGPVHAIFNLETKRENHFRTLTPGNRQLGGRVPKEFTTPHALTPGKMHVFRITKNDRGLLRLSVDGRQVFRSKREIEFSGGVMIYSGHQKIEVESIRVQGTPDPLSTPLFVDRNNLEMVEPSPR